MSGDEPEDADRQELLSFLWNDVWFDELTERVYYTHSNDVPSTAQRMTFYEAVVRVARRRLRLATTMRTGVTGGDIVRSLLTSIQERPLNDVDRKSLTEVWQVFCLAAQRHCNKHNRNATRHPSLPLDPGGDDSQPRMQHADPGELPPPEIAIVNEWAALLGLIGVPNCEIAARAMDRLHRLGIVDPLNPIERKILALRLAQWTPTQTCAELGIRRTVFDVYWENILKVARELGNLPAEDDGLDRSDVQE